MAAPAFSGFLANGGFRFPPPSALGTKQKSSASSSVPETRHSKSGALETLASLNPPFTTECKVPIRDGGENQEPPFARNEWIGEAAIRYALVLFSPGRQQCSGNGHSWRRRGWALSGSLLSQLAI